MNTKNTHKNNKNLYSTATNKFAYLLKNVYLYDKFRY